MSRLRAASALAALVLLASAARAEPPDGRLPGPDAETDAWYRAWGVSTEDPDAYLRYGQQLAETRQLHAAEEAYQRALQLAPDRPETHSALADVLIRERRPEEAIAHLEAVLAAGPGPLASSAHTRLGVILGHLDRSDEALSHFEQALALNPDEPGTHLNLAASLERHGRRPEAIDQLQRCLELDPDLQPAHRRLAAMLAGEGRFAEAVPHYQALLAADPRDPSALYGLGLALESLGETDPAQRSLERARDEARRRPGYGKLADELDQRLGGRDAGTVQGPRARETTGP